MTSGTTVELQECLIKAGSQYDAGGASIASVANVVEESIFSTSQIQFLMSNFRQYDWLNAD